MVESRLTEKRFYSLQVFLWFVIIFKDNINLRNWILEKCSVPKIFSMATIPRGGYFLKKKVNYDVFEGLSQKNVRRTDA